MSRVPFNLDPKNDNHESPFVLIDKLIRPSSTPNKRLIAQSAVATVLAVLANFPGLSRLEKFTHIFNKYAFDSHLPYQVIAVPYNIANWGIVLRSFNMTVDMLLELRNLTHTKKKQYQAWLAHHKLYTTLEITSIIIAATFAVTIASTAINEQNKPPVGVSESVFDTFCRFASNATSALLLTRSISSLFNYSPAAKLALSANFDYYERLYSFRRYLIERINDIRLGRVNTRADKENREILNNTLAAGKNNSRVKWTHPACLALSIYLAKPYADSNYRNSAEIDLKGAGAFTNFAANSSYVLMLMLLSFSLASVLQTLFDIGYAKITKTDRSFASAVTPWTVILGLLQLIFITFPSTFAGADRFSEFAPQPINSGKDLGTVFRYVETAAAPINHMDTINAFSFLTKLMKKVTHQDSKEKTLNTFLMALIRKIATDDAFVRELATPAPEHDQENLRQEVEGSLMWGGSTEAQPLLSSNERGNENRLIIVSASTNKQSLWSTAWQRYQKLNGREPAYGFNVNSKFWEALKEMGRIRDHESGTNNLESSYKTFLSLDCSTSTI